jgi:hypothetical protein
MSFVWLKARAALLTVGRCRRPASTASASATILSNFVATRVDTRVTRSLFCGNGNAIPVGGPGVTGREKVAGLTKQASFFSKAPEAHPLTVELQSFADSDYWDAFYRARKEKAGDTTFTRSCKGGT